jgi:SynChlorMet cassette protein ScmC
MQLSFTLPLNRDIAWAFEASGAAENWLESFAGAMGIAPGEGSANRRIHFEVMPRRTGDFFGPRLRQCAKELSREKWKLREFSDMIFFQHPALPEIICEITSGVDGPSRVHQMRLALLPVYIDALLKGGLPVHGALVEIDGSGVILAGRSGAGKSTASRRLPPPGRALGDDLCLVMPDFSGGYRAHPLPTWSAFIGNGGVCQSGSSVPLRAVFFLGQSHEDQCLDLKKNTAAISMAGAAIEVFRSIDFEFPRREEPEVKKALYVNASSMALNIPAFRLRLSLTGRFWERIEEALAKNERKTKGRKPVNPEQRGTEPGRTGCGTNYRSPGCHETEGVTRYGA